MLFIFLAYIQCKYGVVIDAGSSGTRVDIYQMDVKKKTRNISLVLHETIKIKISDCVQNEDLIEKLGSEVLKKLDVEYLQKEAKKTQLYFYATAGMRKFTSDEQNKVMSKMYAYLKANSKFIITQEHVRVIGGYEEGIFGWISINYLYGLLDSTTSAMSDMGGASLEITYEVSPKAVLNSTENFYDITDHFTKSKKRVFSYSYMGYGVNSAFAKVYDHLIETSNNNDNKIENPCFYKGYEESYKDVTFTGTSDVEKCTELIREINLNTTNKSVELPFIQEQSTFTMISYFSYIVVGYLGKKSADFTLEDMEEGIKKLDGLTFEEECQRHPSIGKEYLYQYFYALIYLYLTITEKYQLDSTKTFRAPSEINGKDISWAVGVVIADVKPAKPQLQWYYCILIVLSVLIVIGIIGFIIFYLKKKKNTEQKSSISSNLLQ